MLAGRLGRLLTRSREEAAAFWICWTLFRRDPALVNPRSFAALWPALLWLAACLFLGDVAVRRIAIDVDRIKQAAINEWRKLRGQGVTVASDYMEKLKSRKAEVDEQLERSHTTATQSEISPDLFPAAPPARMTAAADAAMPMHTVETSERMNCMVS